MKTKDGIDLSAWYFYETELEGKKIRLPISGIALSLRVSTNRIINEALEIASKDACCSQQPEKELR